jgi:hypothetical protein
MIVRYLDYLVALAHERHFARAAAERATPPPPSRIYPPRPGRCRGNPWTRQYWKAQVRADRDVVGFLQISEVLREALEDGITLLQEMRDADALHDLVKLGRPPCIQSPVGEQNQPFCSLPDGAPILPGVPGRSFLNSGGTVRPCTNTEKATTAKVTVTMAS